MAAAINAENQIETSEDRSLLILHSVAPTNALHCEQESTKTPIPSQAVLQSPVAQWCILEDSQWTLHISHMPIKARGFQEASFFPDVKEFRSFPN